MKNIIKILVVALVSCQFAMAQTITKTASNNNPMLGEEFYYTVTITNLNSFSDLNYVEDDLGINLDYLGIEYNAALRSVKSLFCGGINETISNPLTSNTLRVDFSTCGVMVSGVSNFSFKIKVKLNAGACEKDDHSNWVTMNINNNVNITSNKCVVTINKDDPYELEKVFNNYDASTGEMTYDIRLNSAYGDFGMLDFSNLPKFSDTFKIPACLDMGANPKNNIKVVYIPNESTMTQQAVNYNVALNGSSLSLGWDLPSSTITNTSILYQVIIKIEDCACVNQLFSLENTADFKGFNKCGIPIKKSSTSNISNVACVNNEIDIPGDQDLCFSKVVEIDDNDLNLVMKGCTGKYIITVRNCSTRYIYKSVNVTDLLPPGTELAYGNPIVTTNNGTATITGNTLIANATSYLNPETPSSNPRDYSFTIEIPFKVVTNTPSLVIKNCATVDVYGYNSITNTPVTLNSEPSCASIKTVPNTVALHTSKTICNPPDGMCGPFPISTNVPGDTVEYALHFYNYGTAEGDDFFLEDILPANFRINNPNTDIKVFKKESGMNEKNNICTAAGFKPIDNKVKKKYSPTSNKLFIDFKNNKLDEFTCKGVTHYLVKVKAKIDVGTPNGTYVNEFFVNYRDTSIPTRDIASSNTVESVINVDNLIIASKTVNKNYPDEDCENKTKKYTYTIVLANMGQIPVFADIDDVLSSPAPANLLSYGNFKICQSTTTGLCTPTAPNGMTAPNGIPTSRTANSFNITGLELKPCEVTVITYEAVFDINPLSKNQEVKVCNDAKLRTYVDEASQIQPVVTSNQSLIQYYLDAPTSKEKLEIIELIKETKRNPKTLTNSKKNASKRSNSSRSNRNINFDYGIETLEDCLDLKDCLPPKEAGCFSDNSSSFDFDILGMNRNGEILTSLTNHSPGNRITQIEYLLTDVQHIKTCEDQFFYKNGKRYTRVCNSCSTNVTGPFITTSLAPIGSLNYTSQLPFSGTYKESNNVEFKGQPTTVLQDNRTFKFPVGVNCNGTFEFTITAIVHFEDCSVCYVTDVFDYNASFRFVIPDRRVPVLVRPR